MGMFDDISFELKCPNCRTLIKGFQSKDGACCMRLLNFWEVNNFYASCNNCNTWIEYTLKLKRRPNRKLTIRDYHKGVRIPTKMKQREHKKKYEKFAKLIKEERT